MSGKVGAARRRSRGMPGARFAPGGVALAISAEEVLASEVSLSRLVAQLVDAIAWRRPVALRPYMLGEQDAALSHFDSLCHRLARGLARAGQDPCAIALILPANGLSIERMWQIRLQTLGAGPVYVPCSDARSCTSADDFWLEAWQLRNEPHIHTVFWPVVSSACRLLNDEHADNVIPGAALHAPTGSAWLHTEVRLQELMCGDDLDVDALHCAARQFVCNADMFLEVCTWPTASMQHDAWMNRRLAIEITGIGEHALKLDPGRLSTLRTLRHILFQIRRALRQASKRLAQVAAPAPAIDACNPAASLPRGQPRDAWERRWQRSVARSATRNRCLLALSPWDLFAGGKADLRFADLAPLLAFADVCSFRRHVSIDCWKANEFKYFHQRVQAAMRHNGARTLIAERL